MAESMKCLGKVGLKRLVKVELAKVKLAKVKLKILGEQLTPIN